MIHFTELFDGEAGSKVLAYFLSFPSQKTSAAQLLRKIKLARKTAFDALRKYSFLLKKEKIGNSILYSLDFGNPVARQLKILFTLSALAGEIPKDFQGQVFLFGSAARGEDMEESDWDVLVISSKRLTFENPKIKPVFFTPLEYSALARKDRAFFDGIEKNKTRLH